MMEGISIEIPGFGRYLIRTVVTDYTGTVSLDGKIDPGVKERLLELRSRVDLRVVTADSFGRARKELEGVVEPEILPAGRRHDLDKQDFVRRFETQSVVAFGNGNNNRLMFKTIKEGGGLTIAVDNGEGCAVDTILNAHLHIFGAVNALDLLLKADGTRLKATLRR
jgi:soluble P-type ATPase